MVESRPRGITILSLITTVVVTLNLLSGLGYLRINIILGGWILMVGIIGLIAVYGLWKLTSWGWQLTIVLYILNVISSGVISFVFRGDILSAYELPPDTAEVYMSAVLFPFLLTIVIALIIISYVYSKRNHFVN